jgi:hypothetical protein
MTISWSSSSGDYNPAHPGSELRISFYIDNTSAPGVINSMINFSLPAGITQGIYAVSLDEAFLGLAENAYRRLDST